MKEYLLLFWNASGDGKYQVDPEEMEKNMHAWQSWIGNVALQGKLVSTKPINWEGMTVSGNDSLDGPAIKEEVMVTGYMLCKADSVDEVESWSKDCPILSHPSGFVEVREVTPFEI